MKKIILAILFVLAMAGMTWSAPTFLITVPASCPGSLVHVGHEVFVNGQHFCTKLGPEATTLRCSQDVPDGEISFSVVGLGIYGKSSAPGPAAPFTKPDGFDDPVPPPTDPPTVELVNDFGAL